MTSANEYSAMANESDKRRANQRAKSRRLSVIFATVTAMIALLTTVVFIVVSTGKRFQSSELLPVASAAVVLLLVFTTFLKLVNEEPSLLLRTLRSVLFPWQLQNRKHAETFARQLQLMRVAKQQAAKAATVEDKALDVEHLIRRSLVRLETEISEVRRRGGINLAMGMSITLLGLGILGYAVYAAPAVQASPAELATYFFPRISLALITEMFAYFFLRLYKLSMTETKYFQNELTGAEARALSILMTVKQDAPTLLASVAKSLATLDRNHVLEKGQTTVEIEQARIESDSLRGLAGTMESLRRRGRNKGNDQLKLDRQ